jgi:hypothetical protein
LLVAAVAARIFILVYAASAEFPRVFGAGDLHGWRSSPWLVMSSHGKTDCAKGSERCGQNSFGEMEFARPQLVSMRDFIGCGVCTVENYS